jgi:ribonuclease BN (tRNA processing enzyme)
VEVIVDDRRVTVQFLGSGDAFGSGGRLQTCLFVEAGQRFLLDCGTSALIGMKRFGISPNTIDLILLTHFHGDHFGGIPFFILDAQLVSKRSGPLVIAGPPGLESRVRDAQESLFPGSSSVTQRFPIEFVELREESPESIGCLKVAAYRVIHASGAPPYALRVECDDKVIAYSGDTEWTDALVRVAEGADLFVCEAYCFGRKIKFHLDYETLISHRAELRCSRLVVTHMNEDMLARLGELDVEAAEDGMRILL